MAKAAAGARPGRKSATRRWREQLEGSTVRMGRGHYYLAGIRSDGRTIWHGRSSYLLPGTAGCHGYTVTVTAGPSAAARARARRPAASSDRHGPTRTRTVTVTVTTRRPSAGLRLQLSAVSPPVDPRDPEPEGHRRRAAAANTGASLRARDRGPDCKKTVDSSMAWLRRRAGVLRGVPAPTRTSALSS